MGVGDQNRAKEITAVLDPMRPGHLAIAIQRGLTGANRLGVAGIHPGNNGGDACAHVAVGVLQGAETDRHTRHISDGVERAGGAGKGQAKITGAGHCVSFRSETRTESRPA